MSIILSVGGELMLSLHEVEESIVKAENEVVLEFVEWLDMEGELIPEGRSWDELAQEFFADVR